MLCFFGRGVPELHYQNCGICSPRNLDSTILCGSAAIFRYGKKTVIPDEDLKSKGGLHELVGQDAFGMFCSLAFEPHHTQQTKQNRQNESKQRNAESAERYLYLKKTTLPPPQKKENLHLVVSFGSLSRKPTHIMQTKKLVKRRQVSCTELGGIIPAVGNIDTNDQRWALWNLGKPMDFFGFFT